MLVGTRNLTGGNSDEGWKIVQSLLQDFFLRLEEKYKGRYPNNVQAGHPAVCAAITAAAPAKRLLVVAGVTGASVDALQCGRQRWIGWMEDQLLFLIYDFRGKEQSDKMPEEYIEFAYSVWEDVTHASEQKKKTKSNHLMKRTALTMLSIGWRFKLLKFI